MQLFFIFPPVGSYTRCSLFPAPVPLYAYSPRCAYSRHTAAEGDAANLHTDSVRTRFLASDSDARMRRHIPSDPAGTEGLWCNFAPASSVANVSRKQLPKSIWTRNWKWRLGLVGEGWLLNAGSWLGPNLLMRRRWLMGRFGPVQAHQKSLLD